LAWNGDSWQDDGNDGLIAQLDADSDLSNWRTWDVNEQLSAVAVLLDRYADSALMTGIDADTTLVARLDAVWEGPSWRTDPSGGLVATLDGDADRASWRAGALSDQLQVVSDLLTGWETPADEQSAEEPVASAEDDLGQPRWNAGSNSWEVYNSDVKAWWLRDEPSGSWFDPTRGAWVPSLHWVVESQVTQLAEQYGKDEWSAKLVSALDDAWGADWQTRFEADGMRTQLDELLPFLREPPAEVIDADTLPETPADVAGEDTVAPSAETAKVLIEEVALPALRSAMAEVPGAESLSPDEIQQIITDVLTELSTESASA
jgi:hypothetical protein